MLRLFCQQSCRRCACPFGSATAPALPLNWDTGGSSSPPAVTAVAEQAAAASAADPPSPAANGSSARAADGTALAVSSGPTAGGTAAAAAPSPTANSSAPSPPSAGSDTPQQQMVDPLFDALQSFVSANAANDSGGGAVPGSCRTDVLNLLR